MVKVRMSTWLAFLVLHRASLLRAADAFWVARSEQVCACLVRVGFVTELHCSRRLGSISHSLFGNFRAEIVALHIIQPPHDFGTKTNQRTCPCNRKTLQLYSQSTSCCSETTGNCATEKVLGTRSFTLELQSRPAIISVMAELFNEWKKKKNDHKKHCTPPGKEFSSSLKRWSQSSPKLSNCISSSSTGKSARRPLHT